MASSETDWITSGSNIILCATALYSSYKLFKNHRGPSVGFFLLGFSAALCLLWTSTSSLQKEAEWTAEVLAPALLSFDLLWLSQDHNTARVLLCGSCLLLGLSDQLSADTLTILTRCLGLSSLSCCLTVCLFAGNALGAAGGVALSLPLLLAQRADTYTFAPLVSPPVTELVKCLLKVLSSIGCWLSVPALDKFLLDVTEQ
ncbi:PREDICTED: uncharacterized protein LOC107082080 [Cyprinodon variegatus]|uniref:uncharacterized protein LOC107082080 n=1 Tax=Cyprinodon variegatus TaxID=28743 RepID=UPI000742A1A9|nr:PREDICTED: uncharacterized protein LOC107082080 [Cyprinodon variegatus]